MLGIMFSSTLLSFSVPAFATEESSTTASEASVTTETSVTKTKAIEEKRKSILPRSLKSMRSKPQLVIKERSKLNKLRA